MAFRGGVMVRAAYRAAITVALTPQALRAYHHG